MFSGVLVVVLVILLMCRRIIWHGICFVVGERILARKAKAKIKTEDLD